MDVMYKGQTWIYRDDMRRKAFILCVGRHKVFYENVTSDGQTYETCLNISNFRLVWSLRHNNV